MMVLRSGTAASSQRGGSLRPFRDRTTQLNKVLPSWSHSKQRFPKFPNIVPFAQGDVRVGERVGDGAEEAASKDTFEDEELLKINPNAISPPDSDEIQIIESAALAAKLERLWENFAIPFDYFTPTMIAGVTAAGLGFFQSALTSPSLDAFSLESLQTFQLPVQSVIFGAVFLQSIAGWGFALAAIAGVSSFAPGFTVKDAQALIAVIAVPVDTGMFFPYLKSGTFNGQLIDRWVIGALIGTPFGVIGLKYLDEKVALFGLGSMLLVYCAYASYDVLRCYHQREMSKLNPLDAEFATACKMPPETFPNAWTWASGLIAGLLGGAFDAPGPPLVIFADLTGLANNAEMTRANLLAYFALESQLVAITDLFDGRYANGLIWPTITLAIPSMLAANVAGTWCSQFIDQEKFRWVVIALLAACGLHQTGVF